ncbi:MAG: MBL fold metallo-hydrolase [Verrucomicrobiae bacterium]|nr:MBL fold metallo-hydrolase [Verrucomicrobiae bacterium]MDW7980315.1 MBL fold metallo-hydrolase [Verrucomicrobiales bacterium]
MRLTILGSGSAGNSAYVESDDVRLLIDAGLSLRQVRQRLADLGRAPERISGILLTHEHADHVKGLLGLADRLGIPVYCNRATKEAIQSGFAAKLDWRIFSTGEPFEIGDIGIETFALPHDAQDPVGFVLHNEAGCIGFVTDLGHVTKLVIARARAANVLVLETNHDVQMLLDCPHRPWRLKQRILSKYGHLSNEDAANALEQIVTSELSCVFLGHLSRQCNRPELAYRVVRERLDRLGAHHVRLELTYQTRPSATIELRQGQAWQLAPHSVSTMQLTGTLFPDL